MILPFLNGILGFSKIPVTWGLVFINSMVLALSLGYSSQSEKNIDLVMDDEEFIVTQGRVYSQYIKNNKSKYSETILRLEGLAHSGDLEKVKLLGNLAFRDEVFFKEAASLQHSGDAVAIQEWKDKLSQLKQYQELSPSYMFGLNSEELGLTKWISYMFVHSGFVHFFGNMLFLLIFGSVLEPLLGGLGLLIVFLCSGMVAAGSYILWSGPSLAPLIGSSGSVSGMMALFCLLYWKRSVAYLFFFLPARGYSGFLYLPAWLVLGMWFVGDLAGTLSTVPDFGGVAYSAHLGGQMAGALVATILFFLKYKGLREGLDKSPSPKAGSMIPFLPHPEDIQKPFKKSA